MNFVYWAICEILTIFNGGAGTMAIKEELPEQLLDGYEKPEDLSDS